MDRTQDMHSLDRHLPRTVKSYLEGNFYSRINQQAQLDEVFNDLSRIEQNYSAWFADHGVVHVRDAAQQIIHVLDLIHGVLIPARPKQRVDPFMKGYGVILAYFHDIGLVDFSHFGRTMHPEFASQAIFTPEFDALIGAIWDENSGTIAGRLLSLDKAGCLEQPPETILREMVALCAAHSKSKVNGYILNDPVSLHDWVRFILVTDLEDLYRYQMGNSPSAARAPSPASERMELLHKYYTDFSSEAYLWLISANARLQELVQDVIDTLRALRCADALRQRGTTLKTSGGYEVFISQQTGNAVLALRHNQEALYLVEVDDLLSAGEANLASSEITPSGDLRLSFHTGDFPDETGFKRAVDAAALVINDLQADILGSFNHHDPTLKINKSGKDMRILLENLEDNPRFVDQVILQLQRLDSSLSTRLKKVTSLQSASAFERERYLGAGELEWDLEHRAAVLACMNAKGQKTTGMDTEQAYRDVRLVRLKAGENLVESGHPSGFVYVPLNEGLQVLPMGGYESFSVRAWMPLGATGVIRGAVRNATVTVDRDVDLLAIPKEVFLQHWYKPYSMDELRGIFHPTREQVQS